MKIFSTSLAIILALAGYCQTVTLEDTVFIGKDSNGSSIGYTLRLYFNQASDPADDSVKIWQGGSGFIYRGGHGLTNNGVDTASVMYFNSNSIHPCKDSTTAVRHYVDMKFNDKILTFKSNGFDDPCDQMNELLRSNFWVAEGTTVPASWWDDLHEPGGQDTTDTTDPEGIASGYRHQLEVYPNPTNGVITILGSSEPITVFDSFGRVVIDGSTSDQIDLSDQPAGIYLLRSRDSFRRIFKR